MSFDVMVFDASAAPRGRKAFMVWFEQQTKWGESHGYNNPDILPERLRAWFLEMIKTFPPMNGPLRSESDGPEVTDYGLGRSMIYAGFAWPVAQLAEEKTRELAAKHGVGVFEVSSPLQSILLPTGEGSLTSTGD